MGPHHVFTTSIIWTIQTSAPSYPISDSFDAVQGVYLEWLIMLVSICIYFQLPRLIAGFQDDLKMAISAWRKRQRLVANLNLNWRMKMWRTKSSCMLKNEENNCHIDWNEDCILKTVEGLRFEGPCLKCEKVTSKQWCREPHYHITALHKEFSIKIKKKKN